MIKISVVVPVLNSHEVLRRQFLHWGKFIESDTEIIIVDDGSNPPLEYKGKLNVKIVCTNDTRPWTWALARNKGAVWARGEYLLMHDVDHFFMPDTIDMIRSFEGDKIQFKREFAILDENGEFKQDAKTLIEYGLPKNRIKDNGFKMTPLPNNFVMRKEVFFNIGEYHEDLVDRPYPQGEDRQFKKAWCDYMRETGTEVHTERPVMYMFPNGYVLGDVDADPKGLFHKLSRKTKRNYRFNNTKEVA